MSSSTETRSSLWKEVLKSINRIMKSHSLHFYALSIIFLLPVFFTLVVYPSFHLALFHPDYDFNSFTQIHSQISLSSFEIILPTVYALLLILFFLFGLATITYSAVQAFYDKPINLVSSVKSIRNSFFPLLSTFIVSLTNFVSIALVFALVFVFSVQIGLIELKYDSNCFSFFVIFGLILLVPVLIWLQVNWSLAYVITVVESRWGFEALRRSAYLLKGKRWVALSMMLIYGVVMVLLTVCGSMYLVVVDAGKGNRWKNLGMILQTAECSVLGFLMMNQYLVGNVALYMYCKDEFFNGEKSIGNQFAGAGDDVFLLLDDDKNHAIVVQWWDFFSRITIF